MAYPNNYKEEGLGEIEMINIDNIKKNFDDRRILNGVSFSVKNGEIYGIIGKNGAGKTTLMNIIAGLLVPNGGTFNLVSESNQKVGYLPDIPAFFDYLTTGEYIDYLLLDSKNKSKRKEELLVLVGLNGKEKIKTMSRGMKQRLGLAATLVNNPQVLLFDEPTSALDPQGRHEFVEILKKLREEGHSIVLSTHILADMERICDRVGFLHNGIIEKEMCVNDLLEGKKDSWIVTFNKKLQSLSCSQVEITLLNDDTFTYLFESENQKLMLQFLMETDASITSIKNKTISLDELFEEVCQ